MSNEVFDKDLETCLEYALRMKKQGSSAVANYLYECLAESVGKVNGNDVLRFFYGDKVYGETRNASNALTRENTVIKDEKDVMTYAFVAKCAYEVYKFIDTKAPAVSEVNAWAVRGTYTDPDISNFFKWLRKNNGSVVRNDCEEYFLKFCKAIKRGATCKMTDSVAGKPLRVIIDGAVRGTVNVSQDGTLS
jgi:hypothetical protein